MLQISEQKRLAALVALWLLTMEVLSWETSRWSSSSCLVNPDDFKAWHEAGTACPMFHELFFRISVLIADKLADPVWVTAVFTGVLSVSTILLWLVTKKSADAAAVQASAVVASESPVPVIIEIKLVQFAHISGEQVLLDPVPAGPIPPNCRVLIRIGNMGRTVLRIREFCLEKGTFAELPTAPQYAHTEQWDTLLGAQQDAWYRLSDDLVFVTPAHVGGFAATGSFWVYGYFTYSDLLKNTTRHGFLARWAVNHGFVGERRSAYT